MISTYGQDLLRTLERTAALTYYVDGSSGYDDGRYSGRSWRRPFKTIMKARAVVNSRIPASWDPWLKPLAIIYVAPGVYPEAIRPIYNGALVGAGVLGTDTGAEIHPTAGSALRNPPQAVSGAFLATLTTRTDDNTGVLTAAASGHNVVTGDDVDFYWDDPDITAYAGNYNKCRLNMDATVSGLAITVDGGAGDVLPPAGTVGYVIEQTSGNVASQVSGCNTGASIFLNLWFECESAVPCLRFGVFNNSIIADCVIAQGIADLATNAIECDNVSHMHFVNNRIESGVTGFAKGMVFNGGANKFLHASHIERNIIGAVTTGIEIASDCTATGTVIGPENIIARPAKGVDDNNGNSLVVGNYITATSDAIEHAGGASRTIGNWVINNATAALESAHAT